MALKFEYEKPRKYRGVTITAYRRIGGAGPDDFGYETDIGIGGTGQSSVEQALDAAKRAIDEKLDSETP